MINYRCIDYYIEQQMVELDQNQLRFHIGYYHRRKRNLVSNMDCNAKISSACFSKFVIINLCSYKLQQFFKSETINQAHELFFHFYAITTLYESVCQYKKEKEKT